LMKADVQEPTLKNWPLNVGFVPESGHWANIGPKGCL